MNVYVHIRCQIKVIEKWAINLIGYLHYELQGFFYELNTMWYVQILWNPSKPATLGTCESVLIRRVATFQR